MEVNNYSHTKMAELVSNHQRDIPTKNKCKRQDIENLLKKNSATVRYQTALAAAMGTTAEVLATGRFVPNGPNETHKPTVAIAGNFEPQEDYIRLEHLSAEPQMGDGGVVQNHVRVVRHIDVLEQWVRQKIGVANPGRIKILTGNGNSMESTILDQDLVFVDTAQRTISAPGIYVIDVAGRLLLKKAMIQSDGTLILRSDNTKEYPDEERHDLNKIADTIHVSGKVMAWWTLRH